MAEKNVVYSINGPVVTVKDTKAFSMLEMVYVGHKGLVGEVIGITDQFTTIQVYEVTTGLRPGEPVKGTGAPMSVLLGRASSAIFLMALNVLCAALRKKRALLLGKAVIFPP